MALSVGRVIARLRRNYEKIITSDIDADSIVEMIYRDSANEGEGHYEWQEQKYCC